MQDSKETVSNGQVSSNLSTHFHTFMHTCIKHIFRKLKVAWLFSSLTRICNNHYHSGDFFLTFFRMVINPHLGCRLSVSDFKIIIFIPLMYWAAPERLLRWYWSSVTFSNLIRFIKGDTKQWFFQNASISVTFFQLQLDYIRRSTKSVIFVL